MEFLLEIKVDNYKQIRKQKDIERARRKGGREGRSDVDMA
jgi:hypothetical protein